MTSYTSFTKILNNKKNPSEPSGLCHREIQYIKHLSRTELRIVIAFWRFNFFPFIIVTCSDLEVGSFAA